MADQIYPGQLFFENHNSPYQLLKYTEPGLCLDVGAAEGRTASKMASASPSSEILAFEPFEGNIPHFKRLVGDIPNIRLIQKAVSDFDGDGQLYVSATLTGSEKGWEGRDGYSSSGTLISSSHPKFNSAKSNLVPVCSVDKVVSGPVRFMKVDVQGGEIGVLNGADNTITHHGIDMIFIEYEGDRRIIDFLLKRNYILIDSGYYMYSQKPGGPSAAEVSPEFKASTVASGREVAAGELVDRPLEAEKYIEYFNELGKLALHTDLLAVRRDYLSQFLHAVADLQKDA